MDSAYLSAPASTGRPGCGGISALGGTRSRGRQRGCGSTRTPISTRRASTTCGDPVVVGAVASAAGSRSAAAGWGSSA
ncbi:hypothetical protein ACFPM0_26385 [Pseudonocardia sulfidoxydans]|uniref:hypothetical protein n=1 Tax=Pseudonocardia sulfidoxydans TaxID=54011 RepID=UPI003611E049